MSWKWSSALLGPLPKKKLSLSSSNDWSKNVNVMEFINQENHDFPEFVKWQPERRMEGWTHGSTNKWIINKKCGWTDRWASEGSTNTLSTQSRRHTWRNLIWLLFLGTIISNKRSLDAISRNQIESNKKKAISRCILIENNGKYLLKFKSGKFELNQACKKWGIPFENEMRENQK